MNFRTDKIAQGCLGLLLITCLLCLAFPRMDGDAAVYALLAKHMVQHGDWVNLVFQGSDWLDKPHFPFWMVALSFQLFGMGERSYLLPGLAFYAMGAWFTWKLARHFYDDAVAGLAALIYLSLLGLLLGATDQKAEVYLLGLMAGASYAWLKFDEAEHWPQLWRYGLLGAVCTASALATKGVFVLALLGVGVFARLVYLRAWQRLLHGKWLLAAAACLLCLLPELLALYWQFDAQPEKAVFGRTQVSGLKFFVWDSQFGRFFNTGPIKNAGGSPLFFVHNTVWTFFPWTVLLVAALGSAVRTVFWKPADSAQVDGARHREASVFLWATFLSAFALFSATRYQMDYYLIIVFPYAAIACAQWLARRPQLARWWRCAHLGFSAVLMVLALVCAGLYAWGTVDLWMLLVAVPALVLARVLQRHGKNAAVLAVPLAAVLAVFMFTLLFHRDLYLRYNVGYPMARYVNTQTPHPVYVYNMVFNTFDFFSTAPTLQLFGPGALAKQLKPACGAAAKPEPFYVVARASDLPALAQEVAAGTGCPVALEQASAATAPLTPGVARTLRVQTLQQFEEIELPKQFVRQLVKSDAVLPRQTLLVLQVSASD